MMNLKYYLRGLGIGIIVTALIMGITAGGKKETLSNEEIKERAKALGMTEESIVLADLVSEASKGAEDGEGDGIVASPEPSIGPEAEESLSPSPSQDPESEAGAEPSASQLPEKEATPVPSASQIPEAETSPVPSASRSPEAKASPVPSASSKTPGSVPTETPGKNAAASPEAGKVPSASPAQNQTPSASPKPADQNPGQETVTIEIVSGDTSYSICGKLEKAGLVESAYEYDLYLCENGYDKRLNVGTFEVPVGAKPDEIAKILARM